MATQLQIRRGTSTQVAAFTGAEGEIVVNTTNDSVHVNDGSTQGGFELARVDGSNWAVTNSISIGGSTTVAKGSDGASILTLSGAAAGRKLDFQSFTNSGAAGAGFDLDATSGQGAITLSTTGAQRVKVDSTGIDVTGAISASGDLNLSSAGPGITLTDTDNNPDYQIKNGNGSFRIIDTTASSDRININSSGNVGIGTSSPTDTISYGRALDIQSSTGAAVYLRDSGDTSEYTALGYEGGSTKAFSVYNKAAGDVRIYTNGQQRVTVNSSGNVGIGVTNMGADGLSLDASMNLSFSEAANSSFANIFRQASSAATVIANGYKHISTANKMASSLSSNWAKAAMAVNYGTIRFYTDAAATNSVGTELTPSERMRIDSSGNLLIGVTATTIPGVGNTTAGVSIRGNDGSFFSRSLGSGDTNNVVSINRTTAEGPILGFALNGTQVGGIGTRTVTELYLDLGSSGLTGSSTGGGAVLPTSGGTNYTDAAVDLGFSAGRFKNLYLSGGVYLGGTGAGNKLDDYEEGTWTPTIASGTFENVRARYTKVGRLVQCYLHIRTFSDVSSGTTFQINSLPFPAESTNVAATLGFLGAHISNIGAITGAYLNTTTQILLYNTSTGGFQNLKHSDLNTNSSIYAAFSYFST